MTAAGECSFRAAIAEANANPGATIRFDDIPVTNGVARIVLDQSNTSIELEVSGDVTIRGDTAPGYTNGDAPVVYVDGTNMSSSADDVFEIRGTGTFLRAIGVVNAPDDGINLIGADDTTIQLCWVGVDPDGTAAANGFNSADVGAGIHVASGTGWTIGQVSRFIAGSNVIAGNVGHGVFVSDGSNTGDRNGEIGANYIGILPDNTVRGNDGYGIYLDEVDVVSVGVYDGSEYHGSVIAGNTMGGIYSLGLENTIIANILGAGVDGTSTGSQYAPGGVGIVVAQGPTPDQGDDGRRRKTNVGDDNLTDGSANVIGNYAVGIQTGDSVNGTVYDANNHPVHGNRIGVGRNGESLPIGAVGVSNTLTDTLLIQNNVIGNVGAGNAEDAAVFTDNDGSRTLDVHFIEDNYIGMTEASADAPINGHGIFARTVDDFTTLNLRGQNATQYVGNTSKSAVFIDGFDRLFMDNMFVGVKPNGSAAAISGSGVQATNGTRGTVRESLISNTSAAGVSITGADSRVQIRENRIEEVGTLPIDLGGDGQTPNDTGSDADADTGPNQLQNSPEISAVVACTPGASNDTVELEYFVESKPGNANFGVDGLYVEFFVATQDAPGGTYLGTDRYKETDAPFAKTATLTGSNLCGQASGPYVSATATDVNGNTSEYSVSPQELPVELASFTVLGQGDEGLLRWTTAAEENNAGFDIQHKTKGADWSKLGFVEGAGTTSNPTSYEYTTETLVAGRHSFRLVQIDLDGTRTIVGETAMQVRLQTALVFESVYPNPSTGRITLTFGAQEGRPLKIGVFDLLGRRVQTLAVNGSASGGLVTQTFDLRSLTTGRYFIRVTSDGHQVTRPMILVQ